MDEVADRKGFSRFAKHILLGSVFCGMILAIPAPNYLFCLTNLLGASCIVFALWMHLKVNPEDNVSTGEVAGFGATAGAGAGLITCCVAYLLPSGAEHASAIEGGLASIDGPFAGVSAWVVYVAVVAPLLAALFAALGALGTLLSMHMFFNRRIRRH
jgi:hypothetical protein